MSSDLTWVYKKIWKLAQRKNKRQQQQELLQPDPMTKFMYALKAKESKKIVFC